jgi:hypothetical protein
MISDVGLLSSSILDLSLCFASCATIDHMVLPVWHEQRFLELSASLASCATPRPFGLEAKPSEVKGIAQKTKLPAGIDRRILEKLMIYTKLENMRVR